MERSAVPALTRAMRIVDALSDAGQVGASVAELSGQLGIAKSTTALLCQVLEEEGLARRVEGRYRLGRRFLVLSGSYLNSMDQLGEFYDECRRQPIISREAGRVALLDGTDVLYIARYEGATPNRRTGQIGDRFPASVTATGKAILATLPPEAVEDRFRGKVFQRYTERSIQSLPELVADLQRCVERGYAVDDEETNLGLVCYSVPVTNVPGQPSSLSVSTTMTTLRASEVDVDAVVAELRILAETLANPLDGQTY